MKPQAVVFDIGNVLINWQPERFFDGVIGEDQRRAMFANVDLYGMNNRVDLGEAIGDVIAETATANPDWRDEIMLWHDRWLDIASPEVDHSVRLMSALKVRGVPVFSLTNFGIQTYRIAAKRYPFLDQFDRDFISGHLGVVKPDPAIYATLEDTSGLPPQSLLFTDDRRENITAAEVRGWQVHHFEGPQGWANRLVSADLLTEDEAQ